MKLFPWYYINHIPIKMSFIALLITSYILVTLCTTITTIYGMVNMIDIMEVVPIVQGLTSGILLVYDIIILYLLHRRTKYIKLLICIILALSTIIHIALFSLTLSYFLRRIELLLPFIYSITILSTIIDLMTYILVYKYLAYPFPVNPEITRLI
jgi:hypothetical protein